MWTRFAAMLWKVGESDRSRDARKVAERSAALGAVPVGQCRSGVFATVAGRVSAVCVPAAGSTEPFEVTVFDGHRYAVVLFPLRRQVAGLRPGAEVAVSGRPRCVDGQVVFFAPRYQLLPAAG